MHCRPLIALSLGLTCAAQAEEEWLPPAETLGEVRTWLNENVEPWAFEVVGLDAREVDERLGVIQAAVEQTRPASATPTRADAEVVIQALDRFEPTRASAAWLRALLEGQPIAGSTDTVPPPVAVPPPPPGDPLRLAWEQRLRTQSVPARAANWVPELKAIFTSEGVPPELVWLAEVESSFNPAAQSRVGAAGLFQLMPDTAEELGLSVGLWHDERRDAHQSARAAARYLRGLRRQFQDWHLAVAAYNAGPGRVAYLLRTLEASDYAAIADRLPPETQQYVPKVEATLWVREGVELRELPARVGRDGTAAAPLTDRPASDRPGPG